MSNKIENLVKKLGINGKNACLLMSNISSYKKNKTLENISKIIEKNKYLILIFLKKIERLYTYSLFIITCK